MKFVDSEGLKRYNANMRNLLKRKVTKKRSYGQIVIGKSINPMSCVWQTVYCFRETPSITIWSDNKIETFRIYTWDGSVYDKGVEYKSIGVEKTNKKRAIYSHFIRLQRQPTPCGFAVMSTYSKGDTDIYLRKVDIPSYNLTGTSAKYNWNCEKRVTSRKGTFEMACRVLRFKFEDIDIRTHVGIVKSCQIKNVIAVPYYMHRVSRSKAYRDKFPNKTKYHTRFTRKSDRPGGGLWLVRFYDRKSRTYMNDIKVYVRVGIDKKLLFKRA